MARLAGAGEFPECAPGRVVPSIRDRRQRRGPFVFERLDRSTADLIVAVDGKAVKTVADFREAIESLNPGDTVQLTVLRKDQQLNIRVQLGGGPPKPKASGTRL